MGRTKLGEERIRGLRRSRPLEATNRSCPVCLVAADKCPESTARNCKDDDTAIRPMWGAVAVDVCKRGKRQKTNKVECLWQNITQVKDDSRAIETG